jgi:hypothetical protein
MAHNWSRPDVEAEQSDGGFVLFTMTNKVTLVVAPVVTTGVSNDARLKPLTSVSPELIDNRFLQVTSSVPTSFSPTFAFYVGFQ